MVAAIIVVLVLIAVIIILSLGLYHKDKKSAGSHSTVKRKVAQSKPIEDASIEEIARRVATEKLSEKELMSLANLVAKKFKFPGKNSGQSPEHHFDFIRQFCLNENTGGATIVRMSNTLKTLNPNFRTQIEDAERDAVRERDIANSRK